MSVITQKAPHLFSAEMGNLFSTNLGTDSILWLVLPFPSVNVPNWSVLLDCVCVCVYMDIYICIYMFLYVYICIFIWISDILNQVLFPDISCSGSLFDNGDDRVPLPPLPFSGVSEQNLPDSKPDYWGRNYMMWKSQAHHCCWIYLQIIFYLPNSSFCLFGPWV